METRTYVCKYCQKEYLPKRRRVQKFCSSSCRVSSHRLQYKKKDNQLDSSKKENNQIKINKMSSAGIGNAALGSMASDFLISTFTPEANKPATRGQMNQLINKIKRYQEIRNHPDNVRGEKAYYDNELKIIVFRKKSFS